MHFPKIHDNIISMLKVKEKENIIKSFQSHQTDTGSSEVQVAIFTEEIKRLTEHLKKHQKDHHSRRGLLKMAAKRKKLLDYLKKENEKRYKLVIKKLDLKK